MVKTGRGGGLKGSDGPGTRNKALDLGVFRPLRKAQTPNKSFVATNQEQEPRTKNKSNKPKTFNKSLSQTSSTVVNPASAPESGGSMFESETGEEEPIDKDKGKRFPGAHFKLSKNFCLFYLALHFQVKTTTWKKAK